MVFRVSDDVIEKFGKLQQNLNSIVLRLDEYLFIIRFIYLSDSMCALEIIHDSRSVSKRWRETFILFESKQLHWIYEYFFIFTYR